MAQAALSDSIVGVMVVDSLLCVAIISATVLTEHFKASQITTIVFTDMSKHLLMKKRASFTQVDM